jgi:hypothetical protein
MKRLINDQAEEHVGRCYCKRQAKLSDVTVVQCTANIVVWLETAVPV